MARTRDQGKRGGRRLRRVNPGPLTEDASVLAYLGREKEATIDGIAAALRVDYFVVYRAARKLLARNAVTSRIGRRPQVGSPPDLFRLTANGRRLLDKQRISVAEAYGL